MNTEATAESEAEVLLRQLMHLKNYEIPETARMTRNKQNIMRQVRQTQAGKRRSLGELMEMNMPWFFAEPKYGIAALFVAFIGLQYAGMTSRNSSQSTGIYTTASNMASFEQATTVTNSAYPRLPNNYPLFRSPEGGDGTVVPVGFQYRE
ncbi:hypothetical protein [Pontiella desulfatans]|nr:hypothetical protein [Pontiella desulfatans]